MFNFIINCIFWVCALYGFLEIIKNIIYIHSFSKIKTNGIHMIIAVKNEENKIEGFLRNLIFRILYGKEDYIENIIVLDLNSSDNTKHIVEKFTNEYSNIKLINWKEFEELFTAINDNTN